MDKKCYLHKFLMKCPVCGWTYWKFFTQSQYDLCDRTMVMFYEKKRFKNVSECPGCNIMTVNDVIAFEAIEKESKKKINKKEATI